MLKISYPEDRTDFHKKYINSLGITNKMRNKFFKLMNNTSLKRFNINNLNYILLAPFDDLLKVIYSNNLTGRELKVLKLFFNYDFTSTNKFQPKIKSFFENELTIKTCYFCNIDFVNSFNDLDDYHDAVDFLKRANESELCKIQAIGTATASNIILNRSNIFSLRTIRNSKKILSNIKNMKLKEKHSHFTLDHVLDKASHPLIALSLYNFVPSCYSCNSKFKGSDQFIDNDSMGYLSPTSNNFSFINNVKFKLYFHNGKNTSTIQTDNDFILDFSYSSNSDAYKKYIDIFKLKGRYIFHKNEVVNLVKQKEKYSQSQIEEIANIMCISSEQIKKDVFGKELFDGNIEDVSMTKFKQDVAKDIGLI